MGNPWEYTLSAEDVEIAARFAVDSSAKYAGGDRWKSGSIDGVKIGGNTLDGKSATIYAGKVGEIAFGRITGVPPDLRVLEFGDSGHDFTMSDGTTVDVKRGGSLDYYYVKTDKAKAAVFAFYDAPRHAQAGDLVRFTGWLPRALVIVGDVMPGTARGANWQNYTVPKVFAYRMDELIRGG